MEAAESKRPAALELPAGDKPEEARPSAWSFQRILPLAILSCVLLVIWMLQHPGAGLHHDAKFYLIQALASFDPTLFGQDIFLRYGSQDRFTIFSPLFAGAMRVFGIEGAAPVLTFVAHVAFISAAVVLARMLMPTRLVWLAIGLLLAVPTFYGPGRIFAVIEDFATPRLLAETFVVAGLAAYIKQRYWLAGFLALAGLVLHPLMTVGGVGIALFMSQTPPRVRIAAIALGVVGAGALLTWMHVQGQPLQFDAEWVRLIRDALAYLWPTSWTFTTWAPMVVTAITLVIGVMVLEHSTARSLCISGLIVSAAGVVLTYVGDLFEIVIVIQGQAYRWLWLPTLTSILLMPLIAQHLWAREARVPRCQCRGTRAC